MGDITHGESWGEWYNREGNMDDIEERGGKLEWFLSAQEWSVGGGGGYNEWGKGLVRS